MQPSKLIIKNISVFSNNHFETNLDILIEDGLISQIASSIEAGRDTRIINGNQKLLTSPLIDCHTHIVYGGGRSNEFEWRLQGETYESIAKKGGGIANTVLATRSASFEQLYLSSKQRLKQMIGLGVQTIEIKSGYGLDIDTELKMLRVAQKLGQDLGVRISPTYLGAHTIPVEYKGRADDYIELVCNEVLPLIKQENLADSVDVFAESIAFNLDQTEKVFSTAIDLGFNIKCHAEQLSNMGASKLAATKGALSCDHLEFLDEESIKSMAEFGTTAVLLPGAYYFLRETKKPPIDLLRKYKIPIAVATDCNPGSSPTTSLPLMMNMACVLFGLTVEEAWLAVIHSAAQALGMNSPNLMAGEEASFVLWPFNKPVDLVYNFGQLQLPRVFIKGVEQRLEEREF